jgi:hypothetical protein
VPAPKTDTPSKYKEAFEKPDDDLLTYYNVDLESGLSAILTEKQQNQMDLLYLNVEGLAALARPHLASRLSLTRDQQKAMWRVIHDSLDKDAREYGRAMFSLLGEEVKTAPPIIQRELRKCALRDDLRIAAILDNKQLEQLAPILNEAVGWEKLAITPGMVSDLSAIDISNAGKP